MSDLTQYEAYSRPDIHEDVVTEILARLYGFRVQNFTEMDSYIDRNYHIMVASKHTNPHIIDICKFGYVLKILNSEESKNPQLIDGHNLMLYHLNKYGIPTSVVIKNLNGSRMTLETVDNSEKRSTSAHIVRLMEYIPGILISKASRSPALLRRVGQFVARMDKALQKFHHPCFDNHIPSWSFNRLKDLSRVISFVQDCEHRKLVEEVIAEFQKDVIPNYDKLQTGHIHGDCNDANILVHKMESNQRTISSVTLYDIAAILDVGDSMFSYIIFELAILICFMMMIGETVDWLDIGGHVLAGFVPVFPITPLEMSILKTCICARFAQTLTYGAYHYAMDPGNDYLLSSSHSWPILRKLWETPKEKLYARWKLILDSNET